MRRFGTLPALVLLFGGHQPGVADDTKARDKALTAAEERLKSICEKREFAPATFPGKWLADGSGYLMLESATPGAEPEVVKYNAEDGKRTIFIGADQLVEPGKKARLFVQRVTQTPVAHKFCLDTRTGQWLFDSKSAELQQLPKEAPQPASTDSFSPHADHIVFRRGRNLSVVDVTTGRVTPLTTDDDRSELENYDANWSPDGRQIAYVQTDSSKVRRRAVIQPTDPSYPEVRFDRFARVGTPIPTLRVGVVDRDGGATRWVKLPADAGTFYIQDISWAGNSKELLIEMQSRSRDHRKFLLANVENEQVATAYEESLVDRLFELGKKFDYMAYPNRDHGLREGKGTPVHLRMLMTRYLLEHLPPGPR